MDFLSFPGTLMSKMSTFNNIKNWVTGEEPRGTGYIADLPVATSPPVLNPTGQQGFEKDFVGFVSSDATAKGRSPLGFHSAKQRGAIRGKAWAAAYTGYLHHNRMIYSEGGSRWSGITGGHRAYRHEYPPVADCSAFVTWCYWDATRAEKTWDFVNSDSWRGGYTGTMTRNGIDVSRSEILMADAVFYGGSWSVPQHVALYIGHGKVISHGQQGDPLIYPIDLFGVLPIRRIKRYIR